VNILDLESASHIFFPMSQQAKSGLGHLIAEVTKSHTIRHKHRVRLLWASDKLAAAAAMCIVHNKHNLNGIRTRDPSN
jgi:ABC-type cobalamin transport system ATPase subunit